MALKPNPLDLHALISATQADLAAAVEHPALRRDPYKQILAGTFGTLGVLSAVMRKWEEGTAAMTAAQAPPAEVMQKAVYDATRKEAARLVRAIDRGQAGKIGLCVAGAYIFGAVSVVAFLMITHAGPFDRAAQSQAAWHDLVTENPDPRPALATATVQSDHGRRYYSGLSLWIDPASPAPGKQ